MKGKVGFLLGAAVGYVLGTRAGRQQYEKIVGAGRSVWEHPKVQDKVAQAESKIGDAVRDQGTRLTDSVAQVVKDKLSGTTKPQGSDSPER